MLLCHCFGDGGTHVGGRGGDDDAGVFQCGDFFFGRSFAAADDRAGVSHSFSGRCGAAGDEGGDRFGDVRFDEGGCFFFGRAADFADHQDRFGLIVFLVQRQAGR